MKLTLAVILLVLANSVFANDVDSLKSDYDVLVFLTHINKRFTSNKLQILPTDSIRKKLSCDSITYKWDIKNWEKADFNGDRKTDLIATVYWYSNFHVFVAVDKGDNTFQLIQLSKDIFQDCELGKPITINSQQLLLFYRITYEFDGYSENLSGYKVKKVVDTLVYKYGGFIEKHETAASYDISQLEYRIEGGEITDKASFKLTIAPNGKAALKATTFYSHKDIPVPQPNKKIVKSIVGLARYIDIKRLKSDYQVSWTDDVTIVLKITFRNGTVKEIKDYGMIGTFGLSRLYELLSIRKVF